MFQFDLFNLSFKELQFGFMVAVDGGSFKMMVDSKEYDEFIRDAIAEYREKYVGEVRMTIAVIGTHGIAESKVNLAYQVNVNLLFHF